MSSKLLQDMFSRRPQDIFSVTIFRPPKRFQDVLRDVLEDETFLRRRCVEERLQDVFKTNKHLLGIYK